MRLPVAAHYSGLSVSFLKKLAASGRLASVAVGRTRLIVVASLDLLLEGDR
jgi:excisionase family DNA binding protein